MKHKFIDLRYISKGFQKRDSQKNLDIIFNSKFYSNFNKLQDTQKMNKKF